MIKDNLRYLSGRTLTLLGLREPIRAFYKFIASSYIKKVSRDIFYAAWIRRSSVNNDFVPVSSDIDLTILLDHKDMWLLPASAVKRKSGLISDVQFF